MFKPGDRVICIDISDSDNLTYKKVYTVLDDTFNGSKTMEELGFDFIIIRNDKNLILCYLTLRFISLKEYRKQKLEKICLSQKIECLY